jgi:hypothetical protein
MNVYGKIVKVEVVLNSKSDLRCLFDVLTSFEDDLGITYFENNESEFLVVGENVKKALELLPLNNFNFYDFLKLTEQ